MAGDDAVEQRLAAIQPLIKEAFSLFDLDHNGFIMIDERLTCDRALKEAMGQEWTEEIAEQRRADFASADTNGDGKVSFDEFTTSLIDEFQKAFDQGVSQEELLGVAQNMIDRAREQLKAGPAPAADGSWQPAVGSIVQIDGSSATEYNGRVGVCEVFNTELGRWVVALDDGERRGVKPDNLVPGPEMTEWTPMPGFSVKIEGSSAPEVNGQAGVIEAFDTAQSRWVVILNNGEKRGVRAENLVQAL